MPVDESNRIRIGRTRPLGLVILVVAVVAGACTSTKNAESTGMTAKPDIVKVINSDIAVGPNRLMFAVKDSAGAYMGSPTMPATFALYTAPGDAGKLVTDSVGTFVWIHEPDRGVYTANFDIASPGAYEIETRTDGTSVRTPIEVKAKSITPAIGSQAPASKTKTVADSTGDLKNITTDEKPDAAMYAITAAQAVQSGKPAVIVFSTPARCTSNMCAPALDIAKEARLRHPEAEFVHIEIYDKPQDLSNDATVPAVSEWRLPTEPWIFVTDTRGRVSAKFESVMTAGEIDEALRRAGPGGQ